MRCQAALIVAGGLALLASEHLALAQDATTAGIKRPIFSATTSPSPDARPKVRVDIDLGAAFGKPLAPSFGGQSSVL